MSKVIFNELLITDIVNKIAKKIEFKDDKNLITSHSNHLGKSLICKSLYYTLGAESFFSDTWKNINSLYSLKFIVDNKEYTIVRKNNMFIIYNNNNFNRYFKIKNLQKALQEIFDLKIFMVAKDENKSLVESAPVFSYIPYYIDQENGWNKETESFDRLSQFDKSQRINSLYYHLGCLDDSYISKNFEFKTLLDTKKQFEKDKEKYLQIISYMQELIKNNGDVVTNQLELDAKLKENKNKFNELLKKLDIIKNEIVKLENEKISFEHSKLTIESFFKKDNKQEKHVETVTCPKCNYQFSIDFKERLKEEYLKETINEDLIDVSMSINKLLEKIQIKTSEYQEINLQINLLEKSIETDQDLYKMYIKLKSAREMISDNNKLLGETETQLSQISSRLKTLSQFLKEYEEKKEKANFTFKSNLFNLFSSLNVSNNEVNANDYNVGDEISASGAYKHRVILAKYYAFLRTKKILAKDITSFPIVIDSPKGDEQDDNNAKIIMEHIINDTSLDNQLIVATIDGEKFLNKECDINKIQLDNKEHELLNANDYKENESIINKYLFELSE